MIGKRLFLLIILFSACTPGFAQDEPFRGWKRTETEHFVFIYEEKDKESVRELLSFCEDAYDRVTNYFDSYPTKIRCVLNGRVDAANGYFSSFPAHMNLYLTAPTVPTFGVKQNNWLQLLFTHELTHYVNVMYKKGFFHVLSLIFGSEIKASDMIFLPGWMLEGITTEFETLFTEGGRGRNPFFEIYYKALIMENELFSLKKASYSSPYPPPGRIYVAGYLILSYMMHEYGKDVFEEIYRRFAAFPFIGPRHAIKMATGRTALSIYYSMKQKLEEKYKTDMELPSARRATPERIGNYRSPLFTEQGIYLYRNTLDEKSAIVQYDPTTKKETELFTVSLTDYTSFTATPDGNTVVFATGKSSYAKMPGTIYTSDLFSLDPQSKKVERITRDKHLYQPAISPDGSTLVAVQQIDTYSRLVVVNRRTGSVTPLFQAKESNVYNPRFSPDGEKICFAFNKKGKQDIWILDFSAAQKNGRSGARRRAPVLSATPLSATPLSATSPEASPVTGPDKAEDYFPRFADNRTILFTSAREGSLRLYAADLADGSVTRICRDRVGAFGGAYHEERLYYCSYRSDGFVINSVPREEGVDVSSLFHKKEAYPPTTRQWSKIGKTAAYLDLPRPLFWLPVPFYVNPLSGIDPVFGAGIYTVSSSILGYSYFEAAVTSRFDIFQPGADIYVSTRLGIFDVYYSLGQGYISSVEGKNYQITNHSLGLELPVINNSLFSVSRSLVFGAGVKHRYRMIGEEPFPFFGIGADHSLLRDHKVSVFQSMRFSLTQLRSPKDLYYPLRLKGNFEGSVPLPVGTVTTTGFEGTGALSFTFPSFIPHHAFKLGLKSDYTTLALFNQTQPINSVSPRGMYGGEVKQSEGVALASLDYLFTLALLDQPLPLGYNMFGLNIQRIGGGFHIEMLADYGIAAPSFSLHDNIYVGLELVMEVGASLSSIPVGTGVSFRFDRRFERTPALAEDLQLYFFIGTDSFQTAAVRSFLKTDGNSR